jgi:hypothetical protein
MHTSRVTSIFTSDLARAVETSLIVASACGVEPGMDPDLREVDVGLWTGKSHDEVRNLYPEEWASWMEGVDHRRGGGETYAELAERVERAVLRICATDARDPVLVVSHGGAIKSYVSKILGVSAAGSGGYARELTQEERDKQQQALADHLKGIDVVVTTAAVPGRRAPRIISAAMVAGMKPGAVIVDVAVDQGGCVETTHETTHADPVYERHGVLHYAVGNIPGAVPHTSTHALTNATLPYLSSLAALGIDGAIDEPALASGINTLHGHVTNAAVAEALGRPSVPLADALA